MQEFNVSVNLANVEVSNGNAVSVLLAKDVPLAVPSANSIMTGTSS